MNLSTLRYPVALLTVAHLAGCGGGGSDTPTPAPVTPLSCADLSGVTIAASDIGLATRGARISSATVVPANSTTGAPEYCDVRGAIVRNDELNGFDINFRVNLPTSWNEKTVQFGGGGYNGSVPAATGNAPGAAPGTVAPLARGYATFASDSGHVGGNAAFALSDEALINFGYAQMKKTRDVAVQLMIRRYGKAPVRTYWVGSSQGGREGVTVAQRFAADYDGILAEVPVLNFAGLQIQGNRVGQAMYDGGTGAGWINAAKVQLIHNSVMAVCDAADGATDGVIANYTACTFDPTVLRCVGGADTGDGCLSDKQIATVNAVHSDMTYGFTVANGLNRYHGWGWGHEYDPAASWRQWVTGTAAPSDTNAGSAIVNFGGQFVRYFIAQDRPGFNPLSTDPVNGFSPSRFQTRIQQVSQIVDGTNPDLSALRARRGKLLLIEHSGDYARSPVATIQYYRSVVTTMTQPVTDEFVRFYIVPSADHGNTGATNWRATQFDWMTALENWVERDQAPADKLETVFAANTAGNPVSQRRALCRFPSYPHYNGGDANTAAGYTCTTNP